MVCGDPAMTQFGQFNFYESGARELPLTVPHKHTMPRRWLPEGYEYTYGPSNTLRAEINT